MTKPWQILFVGFAMIAFGITFTYNPFWIYSIVAAISFLIFTLGFAFQPRTGFIEIYLNAVASENNQRQMLGEQLGEKFPQVFVYKIDLRNMALLFLLAATPLLFLIWYITSHPNRPNDNGSFLQLLWNAPFYLGMFICLFLSKWLDERVLLKNARPFWANLYRYESSNELMGYEFYDDQNLRYYGSVTINLHPEICKDNTCLVIAHKNYLEAHKPYFSFLFHRLILVQRKHAGII